MLRLLGLCIFIAFSPLCWGKPIALADGLMLDAEAAQKHKLTIKMEKVDTFGGLETLVGRVDGRLAYFVSAVPIDQSARKNVLWQRLSAELKRNSDQKRYTLLREGTVASEHAFDIEYKVVDYTQAGTRKIQIYYLLDASKSSYWITATTVVVPELHATLARTNLLVSLLRPASP